MTDTPRVTVPADLVNQAAGLLDCEGYGDVSRQLLKCLPAAPAPEGGAVPDDVRRLVIAARNVAFDTPTQSELRALDIASEAFASRVPWDDEPEALSTREEAPAEAGEDDVQRTASGETVLGFKVAAWQYLGPSDEGDAKCGHRYCEHWSTVGNHPKKVVRLFTEDQLRAALRAQPPARSGEGQ